MKAQIVHAYGDAADMRFENVEDPQPCSGQLLVRVRAASLNPADIKTLRFNPPIAPPPPAILGSDFAGDVVAIGSEVNGFKVGDRVFGMSGGVSGFDGSFAELKRVDPRLVAIIPDTLSYREAAALPLVTLTAHDALFARGNLQAEETLLLTGPTGGVGHVAIQLARARGARIIATASGEEKAELARRLGANEVIQYNSSDVVTEVMRLTNGLGADLIFDTSGANHFDRWVSCAAQQCRILLLATRFSVDMTPVMFKGLTISVPFVYSPMLPGGAPSKQKRVLKAIAKSVEKAELRPVLDEKAFALDQLSEAMTHLENGFATGKVVIDIH